MSLIKAQGVCLGYDGENVIENLDFTVEHGDYLCVLGENGSGKSTLVKALLGLKKVDGGTLDFGDGLSGNKIGYLPQQTPAQKDFPASVYEVVLTGCLGRKNIFGVYSRKDKRQAIDNMAILGISHLKNKCYRTLSGGQQQRVLLARALCATSELLLLDEPVTGLDPVAAQEMYDLLYHLNVDHKITVIMVSHDINAVLKFASHILHITKDEVYFGDKEGYLESNLGRFFAKGGDDNA